MKGSTCGWGPWTCFLENSLRTWSLEHRLALSPHPSPPREHLPLQKRTCCLRGQAFLSSLLCPEWGAGGGPEQSPPWRTEPHCTGGQLVAVGSGSARRALV